MKLPVYTSKGKYVGLVDRDIVHRTGLWHKNVQINIVHNGKLLLQERSDCVDIAKGCFDQSLATHFLAGESIFKAIKRGLREELGIDVERKQLKYIAGPVKIIKHYEYDKDLYNREFIYLYELSWYPKPKTTCPKIKRLFWKDIKLVKKDIKLNPERYTRTFSMWVKKGYI